MIIYPFQEVQWLDVLNMKLNLLKNWLVNTLHLLVFGLNFYLELATGKVFTCSFYLISLAKYTFFSLWFIHLPSHILQSEDRATSILRSAYELLNKFQKTGVHLLTDEVCLYKIFSMKCVILY